MKESLFMLSKRIGSLKGLKVDYRSLILEEAVRIGANASSKKGFPELQDFAESRLRRKIDNRVLSQLFRDAGVLSVDEIKPEHGFVILKEARRLNGTRESAEGLNYLRRFAAKMCTIIIDSSTLSSFLREQLSKPSEKEIIDASSRLWCGAFVSHHSSFAHQTSLPE
jgi:hypothetical protein